MKIEEKDKLDIISLINETKREIKDEDKSSYFVIRKKIEEKVKKMEGLDENILGKMHDALETKEEFNYLLALEIIKKVRSEKSIPYLINFIKNNENGEYWIYCDAALSALVVLGDKAVNLLLKEIKTDFANKKYYSYLVGALVEIKNEEVYSFMLCVLGSYLKNPDLYEGWAKIEMFVSGFAYQGHEEVLSLLRELLSMEHFSESERIEIRDVIERIENPQKVENGAKNELVPFKEYLSLKKEDIDKEKLLNEAIELEHKREYEKVLDNIAKIIAVYPDDYYAKFIGARIEKKIGKPNADLIANSLKQAKKQKANKKMINEIRKEREEIIHLSGKKQSMFNEDFELNFKCLKCGKRQNIKPGRVWQMGMKENLFFDYEVMCKSCFSHQMELTKFGRMDLMSLMTRELYGTDNGFIYANEEVYMEGKKMRLDKAREHILKRIKDEPFNGELYLRAANSFKKFNNEYEKAIEYYEKAIELNPKLIAVYVNLVEIYLHRHRYYKIKNAKQKAIDYLKKMALIFKNQNYDIVTIENPTWIVNFLGEKSEELGMDLEKEFGGRLIKVENPNFKENNFKSRIGRNEPCPCGSGKKYKKCCLRI